MVLLSIGLLFAPSALAMPPEEVDNILYPLQRVDLDFEPTSVIYSGDGVTVFVAGTLSGSQETTAGIIVEFNKPDLSPIREFRLPHSIEALALTPAGDRLIAAGNFNQSSGGVSSILLSNGEIVTARIRSYLQLPSISVGSSGKIYLSRLQSNLIIGVSQNNFDSSSAEDEQFLEVEALAVDSYFFDAKSRIRQIIVSEEDAALFIIPDDETKIYAMELQRFGKIWGDAGYSTEERHARPPLAAFGGRVRSEEYPQGKMSLLLADHQGQMIMVQEYDPKFRTIDLVTIAGVGYTPVPGSFLETLPNSRSIRQPMLIASDRSQTKILSGNIYSRQLVMFTREVGADYLEQVATLELENSPGAIAVNPAGNDAIIAFKDHPALLLLSHPNAATGREETGNVPMETGDEVVRELQKLLTSLGFSVGSIDGVMGARTRHSLRIAAEHYDIEGSLKDLNASIKELKAAVSASAKE